MTELAATPATSDPFMWVLVIIGVLLVGGFFYLRKRGQTPQQALDAFRSKPEVASFETEVRKRLSEFDDKMHDLWESRNSAEGVLGNTYIDRDDLMKDIGKKNIQSPVVLDKLPVHNGNGPVVSFVTVPGEGIRKAPG